MGEQDAGFLSRWSRRKAQGGEVVGEPAAVVVPNEPVRPEGVPQAEGVAEHAIAPEPAAAQAPRPLLPTLDDVALLTRSSDYSRFVAPGVDAGVRNAAMKKLFSDPHFNVMDGLDTYIDDYGKPDPIPLAMLRQMNQSKYLGLFDEEEKPPPQRPEAGPDGASAAALSESGLSEASAPPETLPEDVPDEDPDLRLQQDDAAGRPGPDQGAGA